MSISRVPLWACRGIRSKSKATVDDEEFTSSIVTKKQEKVEEEEDEL